VSSVGTGGIVCLGFALTSPQIARRIEFWSTGKGRSVTYTPEPTGI